MAINRITKSYLDQFREQFSLSDEYNEADLFEMYTTYCILTSRYTDTTIQAAELEAIRTGAGNDWGFDAFIITVNDELVTNIDELKSRLEMKMHIRVKIAFVQAKGTPKLSTAGMEKLFGGIRNVIADLNDDNAKLPPSNEYIDNLREILKLIYNNSSHFFDGENPELTVYYVTDGSVERTGDHDTAEERIKNEVENSALFSNFSVEMLGHMDIAELTRQIKQSNAAKVRISQRITLPEVDGIEQSFLCVLPFAELKKLIVDEGDKFKKGLFEDNVREYQGENPVNRSIGETVNNGDAGSFVVLNNGITIIARSLRNTGDNFEIKDYQIVNGCQTCNVLYRCIKSKDIDNVSVMVKLISSVDKDIRKKIIVANNSQTEVKQEQLVSLLETQRRIEEYYNAQTSHIRLFYERQSKQYRYGDNDVPQDRIVTIGSQIKSFVAMILEEPHKVNGYYGSIVEDFKKKGKDVFSAKYTPALYFLSAYSWYRLSHLASAKRFKLLDKRYIFHVLLVFRLLNQPYQIDKGRNNNEEYCEAFFGILDNRDGWTKKFNEACEIVNPLIKSWSSLSRSAYQSPDFTKELIDATKQHILSIESISDTTKDVANAIAELKNNVPPLNLKVIGKIDLSSLKEKSRKKNGKR